MTANDSGPITCVAAEGFQTWISQAPGSVVLSTYQAGKVALVGWNGRQASVLLRTFDRPMGLAVSADQPRQLAVVTRAQIVLFGDEPRLAPEYPPGAAAGHDALFLPRSAHFTGDLLTHDLAFTAAGLCLVNTRFSCLARLSAHFAFEPFWKPPFITELTPEDRCHLNGLAVRDGQPAFVTALGETDDANGWRSGRANGGLLMDVASGEVVCRGLCMPHSPRWHDGRLWLLNSGAGELCQVEPTSGSRTVVCRLPGYLRGLSFVGSYALVGMGKIRERHLFGGLPIEQRGEPLRCGIAVIDLTRGQTVGLLEFPSGCQELYDVQWLPGVRRPMLLTPGEATTPSALTAPEFGYWMIAT